MLYILYILFIIKLFFLCVRKNVNFFNKLIIIFILSYYPNSYFILANNFNIFTIIIFLLSSYLWLKIIWNINRYLRVDNIKNKSLNILISGRNLMIYHLLSILLQFFYIFLLAIYVVFFKKINAYLIITFTINLILYLIITYAVFLSAALRMLFNAKNLERKYFVFCILFIFIPIINIFPSILLIKYATDTYEYEMNIRSDQVKVESDNCKTKYPILLLHGLCWRDRKKSNYWGRIPNILIQNGATIFYGEHDATNTIENSAYEIRRKINNILKNKKYKKINIIAHSKGGLDARYLITKLHMENKVASLTTISTPHRGSEFSDFICNLPKILFDIFCFIVNFYSKLIGSKLPDIKSSIYQTTTNYLKKFNKEVLNSKKVYYQSYYSAMNNPFSDIILTIPYFIMRLKTKEKIDGLSTISSAKWGTFHQIKKEGFRGLSHADIIDLRRAKIRTFDITDNYIQIVSDLKKKGY